VETNNSDLKLMMIEVNKEQSEEMKTFLRETYTSKLECKDNRSELKAPIYAKLNKAAVLLVSTNIFTAAIVGTAVRFLFK